MKARSVVFKALEHVQQGHLVVNDSQGTHEFGNPSHAMQAELIVSNIEFYRRVLQSGALGLGEAYIAGEWQTTSVPNALGILLTNNIPDAIKGDIRLKIRLLFEYVKTLPRSMRQSRQNVARHYDLGNDFYTLWLDESMTYTSGLILPGQKDISLEQMQQQKLDRVFEQLQIHPGQTLLDIGCGWGELLLQAHSQHGAMPTGITLSLEQHQKVQERILAEAAEESVACRLQDYRDLDDQYDCVTSIEMAEAVGKKYLPLYMQKICDALKPGGLAVLQIITTAKGNDPFIQKYIFPGGYLPNESEIKECALQAGLNIVDQYSLKEGYIRTLQEWYKRFVQSIEQIQQLDPKFTTEFIRMWKYYLQSCEAGFTHGNINVFQYTMRKH